MTTTTAIPTTLIAAALATACAAAQQALTSAEVPMALPTSAVAESIEPVAGRDLYRQVTRVVRGLTWHSKLDRAKAVAGAGDRPIVWIQALGDLDGFT